MQRIWLKNWQAGGLFSLMLRFWMRFLIIRKRMSETLLYIFERERERDKKEFVELKYQYSTYFTMNEQRNGRRRKTLLLEYGTRVDVIFIRLNPRGETPCSLFQWNSARVYDISRSFSRVRALVHPRTSNPCRKSADPSRELSVEMKEMTTRQRVGFKTRSAFPSFDVAQHPYLISLFGTKIKFLITTK